jgi:hypothetical protein
MATANRKPRTSARKEPTQQTPKTSSIPQAPEFIQVNERGIAFLPEDDLPTRIAKQSAFIEAFKAFAGNSARYVRYRAAERRPELRDPKQLEAFWDLLDIASMWEDVFPENDEPRDLAIYAYSGGENYYQGDDQLTRDYETMCSFLTDIIELADGELAQFEDFGKRQGEEYTSTVENLKRVKEGNEDTQRRLFSELEWRKTEGAA